MHVRIRAFVHSDTNLLAFFSLSLQFFNVDNLLKQTLSYSKKRDKSKRKELIFRVHYFRFINKNREVAVNKWTVKKT